jgi:hypothetical protein
VGTGASLPDQPPSPTPPVQPLTDLWLKKDPRGGAFGPDSHLAGSFNMLAAPFAGGFFVGDYEAIGFNGNTFVPFFVQTNCTDTSCMTNRTDVYATFA